MSPLSPPGWYWGRDRNLNYAKIQMYHLLGMPVSHIPTFSPPKVWDIQSGLLVNVHTSVHAYVYGGWSNSPRIGQVLVSNSPLHSPGGEGGSILIGALHWLLYCNNTVTHVYNNYTLSQFYIQLPSWGIVPGRISAFSISPLDLMYSREIILILIYSYKDTALITHSFIIYS